MPGAQERTARARRVAQREGGRCTSAPGVVACCAWAERSASTSGRVGAGTQRRVDD